MLHSSQHQESHIWTPNAGIMHAQVECAISRATKEKRVAELEEALKASTVAFGVRFNKVSVRAAAVSAPAACA